MWRYVPKWQVLRFKFGLCNFCKKEITHAPSYKLKDELISNKTHPDVLLLRSYLVWYDQQLKVALWCFPFKLSALFTENELCLSLMSNKLVDLRIKHLKSRFYILFKTQHCLRPCLSACSLLLPCLYWRIAANLGVLAPSVDRVNGTQKNSSVELMLADFR